MFAKRIVPLDLLVFITVLLIGLVHLPYPFDGDQTLFTIGASKIARGAVLYRDFWDLKQPGIFVFYLIAGKLFGFTEVGIHTLELITMLSLALVLRYTFSKHFENVGVASLLPLLTVGVYYGVARSWHLTQVEGLVGLPMYLCAWLSMTSVQGERNRRSYAFLAGLMGGLVLLFKLLFLPIIASFFISAIAYGVIAKKERVTSVLAQVGLPVLAGLLLPAIVVVIYFARVDALAIVNYTYFTYPSRAVAQLPGWRMASLLKGIFWFLSSFAPLIALATVWLFANWLSPKELLKRNPLFLMLLLWIVMGFVVIVMQRLSWWDYHFMLFVVPVGVLATKGLDILWSELRRIKPSLYAKSRVAALVTMTLLFAPVVVSLTTKTLDLLVNRFAYGNDRRIRYQSEVSEAYRVAFAETDFLSKPDSLTGGLFVAGNPLFYYLSGRDQAIPSNGWMVDLYLREQWEELAHQLTKVRPAYVFVSTEYEEMLSSRGSEVFQVLSEHYKVHRRSAAGTWHVLKSSGT